MDAPRHLAAVVAINAVFAGAYLFGKIGVDHFPPLFFSALRFGLVFVALIPFLRFDRAVRERFGAVLAFCALMGVGVYGTMYLALNAAGGVSAILIGTQFSVPFAAILGYFILREKTSAAVWSGIAVAFAGVMIVGFDAAILGNAGAFVLILFSALFYAAANVISRDLAAINVFALNAWTALFSAPILLALSLLFEEGQLESIHLAAAESSAASGADLIGWIALLYSAFVVTIVGHGGMFALLRRYPVSAVMPYYVLTPIFGVIGGVLFFGESLSARFIIGALLALVGVSVVNRKSRRKKITPADAPEA